MTLDFAALTNAVVAGVRDVRACLLVSREGLALAASPATEEARALTVWDRIAGLGEVDRGFIAARDEHWVFARRGAYVGVAIAGPGARPGVVLDGLDQMLLAAEEARTRRDVVRDPTRPAERESPEAVRGPRTPLHRETKPPVEAPVAGERREAGRTKEDAPAPEWAQRLRSLGQADPGDEAPATTPEPVTERSEPERSEPEPPPPPSAQPVRARADDEEEPWVDRVALAREFAAILTPEERDEEGQ
jgi:hypothetical protein